MDEPDKLSKCASLNSEHITRTRTQSAAKNLDLCAQDSQSHASTGKGNNSSNSVPRISKFHQKSPFSIGKSKPEDKESYQEVILKEYRAGINTTDSFPESRLKFLRQET